MTVSREEIMALIDGELSTTDQARVETAIAADPELARIADQERGLRSQLSAHFAPVLDEPVPDDWLKLIAAASLPAPANDDANDYAAGQTAPNVINLAEARAAKPRWSLPAWGTGMSIAASLALGITIGTYQQDGGPVRVKGGALVASADLTTALNSQLASAADSASYRMIASFPKQGGGWCRAFTGREAAGIACKQGGDWQLQRIMPGSSADGSQSSSAYRQAGSHDGELMALAQSLAAGDPLDAAGEKVARERGWR